MPSGANQNRVILIKVRNGLIFCQIKNKTFYSVQSSTKQFTLYREGPYIVHTVYRAGQTIYINTTLATVTVVAIGTGT